MAFEEFFYIYEDKEIKMEKDKIENDITTTFQGMTFTVKSPKSTVAIDLRQVLALTKNNKVDTFYNEESGIEVHLLSRILELSFESQEKTDEIFEELHSSWIRVLVDYRV